MRMLRGKGPYMLVVNLKEGDYVVINGNIRVYFDHKISTNLLDIGIEAPRDVPVLRSKLQHEEGARRAAKPKREALTHSG